MGHIVSIFIAPDQEDLMQLLRSVIAIKGTGLDGDRYALGLGSWIEKGATTHKPKRNATFIEIESIIEANKNRSYPNMFLPQDTRRNFITSGVKLRELVGREFIFGGARFRGIEPSTPCDRPSKMCGKEGFAAAFEGRGGLNAEVLVTGLVSTRSQITIL